MQRKILIVDDEPHLRRLIQQALEDLEDDGVELFTACDGEEALETIELEKPDLVFLDIMMPKKSGYDVCQSVKNSPRTKSTYVILLTAKGQELDRKRGDDVGADLFITKPFKAQALLDKAREVLQM